MSIFGWDISTSIVGVTALSEDGVWLATEHLDLRKNKGSLLDKVDESEWFVGEFVKKYIGDGYISHFVEERLGNFAAGRTMMQTLTKLAAFNLAFSYMILRESRNLDATQGVAISHIHPSTVKSLVKHEGLLIPKGSDKKITTLNFVKMKIPEFKIDLNRNGKTQPYMYDMADSFIVARAGYLRSRKGSKT